MSLRLPHGFGILLLTGCLACLPGRADLLAPTPANNGSFLFSDGTVTQFEQIYNNDLFNGFTGPIAALRFATSFYTSLGIGVNTFPMPNYTISLAFTSTNADGFATDLLNGGALGDSGILGAGGTLSPVFSGTPAETVDNSNCDTNNNCNVTALTFAFNQSLPVNYVPGTNLLLDIQIDWSNVTAPSPSGAVDFDCVAIGPSGCVSAGSAGFPSTAEFDSASVIGGSLCSPGDPTSLCLAGGLVTDFLTPQDLAPGLSTVPEPSSFWLLGTLVLAIGGARGIQRRRAKARFS